MGLRACGAVMNMLSRPIAVPRFTVDAPFITCVPHALVGPLHCLVASPQRLQCRGPADPELLQTSSRVYFQRSASLVTGRPLPAARGAWFERAGAPVREGRSRASQSGGRPALLRLPSSLLHSGTSAHQQRCVWFARRVRLGQARRAGLKGTTGPQWEPQGLSGNHRA